MTRRAEIDLSRQISAVLAAIEADCEVDTTALFQSLAAMPRDAIARALTIASNRAYRSGAPFLYFGIAASEMLLSIEAYRDAPSPKPRE